MKALRSFLDKQEVHFEKGGSLEKFYPLYEMADTFLYTPNEATKGSTHVRDGIDMKRLMITVALALIPVVLFACYNTGAQALGALQGMGVSEVPGWRGGLFSMLGGVVDSSKICSSFLLGALYFVPIFIVTNIAGGIAETIFAGIRHHEINEGFLVTGLLFPLTLPATIPLWQVAVGIIFGVVIGKEVFGGTGKNFLNPALTARAFLFFAYPGEISGDSVWVAVDGFSGATALAQAASGGVSAISTSWQNAFLGFMPGSMGETSTLACLIGAAFLIITGIGSWRIIFSVFAGMAITALLLNFIGSDTNPMFAMTPAWHLVVGGFAFGAIFMATDPVSASMTFKGQYFYGALIGLMVVVVRVINPAFPEGTMLAILFGNIFAPLIDYFVIKSNIKLREKNYARG
jgi:Na+-transporting NADH:ubiquinone oxidoreductase subunit B